ncbi:MAG: DUF948 domain-containing protein [Patescibacteria group bacterium]
MSVSPSKFDQRTSQATTWIGSKSSIIIHTMLFIACLALVGFGVSTEKVLLILTTAVSLEAIYLSIFIQYSVNQQTRTLKDVAEDIEEVTEDVDELTEEVEEISEDVEEISEDMGEISEDVEELSDSLANRANLQPASVGNLTYDSLEQQLTQILTQVKQLREQSQKTQTDSLVAKPEATNN